MAMRDSPHWVGTWTATPAAGEGAAFSNHTLRMMPRVSIGGRILRVRISNAYGTRPLAVGAAYGRTTERGPAVVAGSNRRLTFGGESSATIAAGALIVSDPVELEVAPLADLAISVHLPADLPASFGSPAAMPGRRTTSRRRETSPRRSVMPAAAHRRLVLRLRRRRHRAGRDGRCRRGRRFADRRQHLDPRRSTAGPRSWRAG